MWINLFLLSLFLTLQARSALAECEKVPPVVEAYLHSHSNWALVGLADLQIDDQKLWNKYHSGLCPGLATASLDDSGRVTYALALLRHSDGKTFEKLILLLGPNAGVAEKVLVDTAPVSNPSVVYRVGPGKSYDYRRGKYVKLKHDSIVYEKLESTSTSYYFENGKLLTLLGSY